MDKTLEEILRAINARFPMGRHCTRIDQMIEGKISVYDEIIIILKVIRDHGGSDKRYLSESDKIDASFYINQLNDYREKSSF
jgi:hypothetical protein